jgi:hypothetical protein
MLKDVGSTRTPRSLDTAAVKNDLFRFAQPILVAVLMKK